MLMGNCENMLLISPTNNEWPSQNHHHNQIDEKGMNHMASRAKIPMDKPSTGSSQEQQQQQQQQALKCPRCDSSNTKFCYYNNYSLTQPRHFCKACKRYWTRGGTLRNVPVGGGCRKNKRIKRPSSSSSNSACSSYSNSANINNDPLLLPPSSSSTPPPPTAATTTLNHHHHHMNPLFYGLPSNPSDLNHLQFSGYDLDLDGHHHQHQHQLSGLGLGFSSSGGLMSNNEDYRNGFASSNSLLSSYGSMFGSSPSTNTSTTATATATTTPTMASIIASSLQQQQKFMQGGGEGGCDQGNRAAANYHFKSLFPFENMQIGSNTNNGDGGGGIGVKVEDGGQQQQQQQQQHRFGWTTNTVPSSQNHQIQQIGSSNDNPSSVYWNSTNWPDLTNIGSSVTSLI